MPFPFQLIARTPTPSERILSASDLRADNHRLCQENFDLRAQLQQKERHLQGVLAHLRTLGVDVRGYQGDWSGVPSHE